MENNSMILTNIIRFINEAIIVGGYGYEFKQAARMILQGKDYDEVLNWYNSQIKGGSNELY